VAEDYRGRFLWYELMTPDPRRAEGFYTRLLGWGTLNGDRILQAADPQGAMFALHGKARKA